MYVPPTPTAQTIVVITPRSLLVAFAICCELFEAKIFLNCANASSNNIKYMMARYILFCLECFWFIESRFGSVALKAIILSI